MKTGKIVCLTGLLTLFFSSCSYKIIRSGYKTPEAHNGNCEVVYKKFYTGGDSVQKVGEIQLKDNGFTTNCSEQDALKMLKQEACNLDAQIVSIVDEKRGNLGSSCYRCTAEFYRYVGERPAGLENDFQYSKERIEDRTKTDNAAMIGAIIGAVVAGFIIGFVVMQ